MARIALLTTPKRMKQQGFPLGLMYLASSLRVSGNHHASIIDTKADAMTVDDSVDILKQYNPDYIGITGMTYEAGDVHKMADVYKQVFNNTPVIIGGPHPTSSPHEAISDTNIDFLIMGEGEESFADLINAIELNLDFSRIPGLGYRENGEVIIVPRQPPRRKTLDELPFPAWDLIDVDKYMNFTRQSVVYAHPRYATIFTSRGCPYQCIYCHPVFGKKWQKRSPENILEEMNFLYNNYGIREFHFADDNFNLDHDRAERICDLIVESGLNVHLSFPNGLRGDILTVGLIAKLKQAGCFMISFAVETATPRLQKYLKKNINFEKIKSAIDESARQGILCNGFFMIGFPGENRQEINETLKFAWKSNLHTASFYTVNPFPGTELFEMTRDRIAHSLDDIINRNYNYLSADHGIGELPNAELQKYLRIANIRFYFNPLRLLKTIRTLPNKSQILYLIVRFLQRTVSRG